MDDDKKYEGSCEDFMKDYSAARRKGISTEQFEDSATDRIADHAGQRRLDEKEGRPKGKPNETGYKPGTPAMKNEPARVSGFKGTHKEGHLRMSGHSGAHRIGSKKK
jgi:hypothetical protein